MIFFSDGFRTKRSRARDGLPMLSSSAVRRQRRHSGLTGKVTREVKNAHRRHRKGIDKTNIHWTEKPTRKDINRQRNLIADRQLERDAKRKSRSWFW